MLGAIYTGFIWTATKARFVLSAPHLAIGPDKEMDMLDVILVAAGFGFFILAIAYAAACERL